MNFRIISDSGTAMYPGQIIFYKVTLLRGITVKWVTEIMQVENGRYFVDEQQFGAYAL